MPKLDQRSSGVLLHPTSLPSRFGIGDMGPGAAQYLRWLADAGVGWWQILPLHPAGPGRSPYSATSTFAGHELLISPERLAEEGLLSAETLAAAPVFADAWVDYDAVAIWKHGILREAFDRHRSQRRVDLLHELAEFRAAHGDWLEDYALFAALKRVHGGAPWYQWPDPLARREPDALTGWSVEFRNEIDFVVFCQFVFLRQWESVRNAAAEAGVSILGDVPIFVALDSADVWAHTELFRLDEGLHPTVVAGVPPDYFSPTGQLWGNPLYDWERMASDGYRWWISRIRHELVLADAVRLDHFRGFAAHWEVPAQDEDARGGVWVDGPGIDLFRAFEEALGGLPFVAEDLGEITPDVVALRKELGLPGMAVLQFGFDTNDTSAFIPYNHERDLVVYTGTHDNNTSLGWFLEDTDDAQRDLVTSYCGSDGTEIHWDLVRQAMASVAGLAIVPHQDLAGLGSDCRMNTPAVAEGNWTFRITPWMLSEEIQRRLAELVTTYGRKPREAPHHSNEG